AFSPAILRHTHSARWGWRWTIACSQWMAPAECRLPTYMWPVPCWRTPSPGARNRAMASAWLPAIGRLKCCWRRTVIEVEDVRLTLDHCVKCNICTTFCPVSNVTTLFTGPKYVGPPAERFRL